MSVSPDYLEMTDEELVSLCQSGDGVALNILTLRFFKPNVKKNGAGYLDGDDLIQEGMFGFLSAVKSYSGDKGVPFSAYAKICIKNREKSAALKTANDFLPFDISVLNSDECDSFDLEGKVESSEALKEVLLQCEKVLSDSEKSVVFYRMSGLSYDEIAAKLGSPRKSVDNALSRARNKLKDVLSN